MSEQRVPLTNKCGGVWTVYVDNRWDVPLIQCSHCHSLTPAEAVNFLKQEGTRFSGSDWKYGWPHKFYIEPLNPNAEKLVENGSQSGPDIDGSDENDYWTCFAHGSTHGRLNAKPTRFPDCTCPRERATGFWSRPSMGKYPRMYTKFYNKHLEDATDEELAEFAALSVKTFGIQWERDEKGIKYSAPKTNSFYGYQQYGQITADGVKHGTEGAAIVEKLRGYLGGMERWASKRIKQL